MTGEKGGEGRNSPVKPCPGARKGAWGCARDAPANPPPGGAKPYAKEPFRMREDKCEAECEARCAHHDGREGLG